jgi:phage baseplate assembly protein W
MADLLGAGLAFPLNVDSRGAVALAAGEVDVSQAIGIVLGTAPGERAMRPAFGCGVHQLVFDTITPGTVARIDEEVRTALGRWEPRIEVKDVLVDLDGASEGRLDIHINYALRTTNHERNLVYPLYIIPAEDEEPAAA